MGADFGFGDGFTRIAQIAEHFMQHVVMAGGFEIGHHHGLGIAGRFFTGLAHLGGGPLAQQFIAACVDFEAQLLVMRVFIFEPFFPVIKTSHTCSNLAVDVCCNCIYG